MMWTQENESTMGYGTGLTPTDFLQVEVIRRIREVEFFHSQYLPLRFSGL